MPYDIRCLAVLVGGLVCLLSARVVVALGR